MLGMCAKFRVESEEPLETGMPNYCTITLVNRYAVQHCVGESINQSNNEIINELNNQSGNQSINV
jgi:hypothetical protein